jgi:hypothetical protein
VLGHASGPADADADADVSHRSNGDANASTWFNADEYACGCANADADDHPDAHGVASPEVIQSIQRLSATAQ